MALCTRNMNTTVRGMVVVGYEGWRWGDEDVDESATSFMCLFFTLVNKCILSKIELIATAKLKIISTTI